MRALNPFTGEFYLETLHVARYTREMYCLFGGRHTHPSTIMPGGCSAHITHQTMTDYYVRLMRYFEYVKRTVPMHDDLYDFFYEALPGYEKVGFRETNLVCWGAFDDPDFVDYDYRTMTDWGRRRVHHARHRDQRRARHDRSRRDQPDDAHPARQLVLRRLGERARPSSRRIRSGTRSTKDHPWNKTTIPKPQARDFTDKYSWVTSPRIYDKRTDTYVCCDTGGGPFARQWVTAKAGLVDLGLPQGDGREHPDDAAEDGRACPRWSSSGRCRSGRTRSSATGPAPTTRPTRRSSASTTSRRRSSRCAPAARRAGRTSRCRRRRSASASTRPRAASSRITW